MKIYLMFPPATQGKPPANCSTPVALKSDLELEKILEQMAGGDEKIYAACEEALFRPLQSMQTITHRHEVLQDVLRNKEIVRQFYLLVSEVEKIPRIYSSPTRILENFNNAVWQLSSFTKILRDLRDLLDKTGGKFQSAGFRHLYATFREQMPDSFFREVQKHLQELQESEILIGAKLGSDLQSIEYTLLRREKGLGLRWRFSPSYTINGEKNPHELEDLRRRRERALNRAKEILMQAARYLHSLLSTLQAELAFYLGCLNLIEKLQAIGMPYCLPTLLPLNTKDRSWRNLYDVSLALIKGSPVVGNDLDAKGKNLFIITGANQGGKSTFLRSIGQAQLMAQCGMPVGAESFTAPLRRDIFTHFKRGEDNWMQRGKLDEELERMSRIAGFLQRDSLVLFNESFAATNEREGAEICRQITQALIDNDVEVFSVTHLYTFAVSFLDHEKAEFLQAQRLEDSRRTFKILPGKPQETAYGEDLYRKIFHNG